MAKGTQLQLPLSEDDVRGLTLGDKVLLSGTIFTARDAAHKLLVSEAAETEPDIPDICGGVIYHCGPVAVLRDGNWIITAAGPTTSSRENRYMPEIIRKYGIRAIIGKGGMGPETCRACTEYGCVYLSASGGAAQILVSAIQRVVKPYKLEEFGVPEAFWQLEVQNFPAIVTIDCHGQSLYDTVQANSRKKLAEIINR